jgi:hypothetical protein
MKRSDGTKARSPETLVSAHRLRDVACGAFPRDETDRRKAQRAALPLIKVSVTALSQAVVKMHR